MIRAATDFAVESRGEGEDRLVWVAPMPDGEIFVLNATSALILEAALELGVRDAVISTLADDFGLPAESVAGDIDVVLQELQERGILHL